MALRAATHIRDYTNSKSEQSAAPHQNSHPLKILNEPSHLRLG